MTDEISALREQLNEMLWDLDDCLGVESFDADVYMKLQALLRTAALRTSDIIVRMKLEKLSTQASPEQTKPRQERPAQHVRQDSLTPSVIGDIDSPHSPREFLPPPTPPPMPAINPWLDPVPSEIDADVVEGWVERRQRADMHAVGEPEEGQPRADSPTYGRRVMSVQIRAPPSEGPVFLDLYGAKRRSTGSLASRRASADTIAHTSSRYSQSSSINSSLPERRTKDGNSLISPVSEFSEPVRHQSSALASPITPTSFLTTSPPQSYRRWPLPEPATPTADESQPSLEAHAHAFEDGLIPVTSEADTLSTAELSALSTSCALTPSSSFHQFGGFCRGADAAMSGQSAIKLVKQPVGMLSSRSATFAKCKFCLFELDWTLVRADQNRDATATQTSSAGVEYRARFLSKCHLPSKRVDETLFACIFCVRAGRTPRPTDATVFFSRNDLLAHVARHARPFPEGATQGLVVIDRDEDGSLPEWRNNFDLHFMSPPTPSPMVGLERELARQPWGMVVETYRSSASEGKVPPDRATTLSVAKGALLGGIEFPARYGGEWVLAWAEDMRGVVPVECIRLRAPRDVEGGFVEKMREKSRMSGLEAVARWKHTQKKEPEPSDRHGEGDGTPWLRFSKGEVLTQIAFPYPEFWCWAGRNSKGKWGLFPHVFTEAGSLTGSQLEREQIPGDDGSVSIWSSENSVRDGGNAKSGVLARLTGRRRDKREKEKERPGGASEKMPRPTVY